MNKNRSVNRRQFIGGGLGAASALGYSLMVNAEELIHFDRDTRELDEIRDTMDGVSPPGIEERIAGEPHMRVVPLECDFCVAGGGMAGVIAALSAARHGAKVVLVQDRSRLGGNGSSEVRMHIVGADMSGGRAGWREGGILEELRLEYMAHNPHQAWEMWDFLLYDKLVSEPGVTLLLDTSVCGAEVKDGQIVEALARCDKTEHLYRIKAKHFADCTGDCRLGLEADAAMRTGHEAQATFDEPLAPETAGEDTLGSSILFTSKDQGEPVPFTPPAWARKIRKEDLKHRGTGSWEFGYWWIEWGGKRNAIYDNERIRFELLAIVMGVWDYIKNSGEHPDSANFAMDWVGMIPGKRASRRIDGPHILTQQDCESKTGPFKDAVCIGGWSLDDHPPGGFDATDQKPCRQIRLDEVYDIPLRTLFSKNIDNLYMAGRNMSASHVAFTSTRVMATCAVEGQAIGTAAAHCAMDGVLPKDLVAAEQKIANLQQVLLRDDQTIKNLGNQDPKDLARKATVTASGSVSGSRPANVIDGFVRDMNGEWKHRWGGAMEDDGAWLQLAWDAPQHIGHIQLTFDSGFSRPLTLTEERGYRARMHIGPQPETVKDYTVLVQTSGGRWHEIARVAGNYQRLRRHTFSPVDAKAVRIHCTATNGNPEARIYEVRCYG
ncbi:MAG: FAD-dependent oxidoreductase [Candidatus Hydrogenedentota bacterium]